MESTKEIETYLMVADLSGYTALTDVHGGTGAALTVARFIQFVSNALSDECRLAERVGDEVIVISSSTEKLLATALQVLSCCQQEPFFPQIHIGLHAGRLLHHEGRLYGAALNLAARIASYAKGNQILCTKEIKEHISTAQVSIQSIGHIRFKNVRQPVEVFQVMPTAASLGTLAIDPVCHMQVSLQKTGLSYYHASQTYYFCSEQCLSLFSADPLLFVGEQTVE